MRVKTRLAIIETKIRHGFGQRAGIVALYDPAHPEQQPIVLPGQQRPGQLGLPPIAVLLPLKLELHDEPK